MASVFNTTALLAENMSNTPWLPWAILAFLIVVFVVVIFFLYLILTYIARGIEFLIGPMAKSRAGQIIFSPAVGVPVFVVAILTVGLIVFFTNQTEIIGFFTEIFG